MSNSEKRRAQTKKLVLGAIMTALVIILQAIASFTTFFGPVSSAVALIPIVIGAAMCGPYIGAWLGFVFGIMVLVDPSTNALFLSFDVPGTIITVLVKGTACGLTAGLVYKWLKNLNRYIAIFAAAIICPVTNTALFLLGSYIFFLDDAANIANLLGLESNGMALFWALATANFLIEIICNLVLSPIFVRILKFENKQK